MTSCAFCGRANDTGSRFCIDCGKSLAPAEAVRIPAGAAPPRDPAAVLQPLPQPARVDSAAATAVAVPPTRISSPVGAAPRGATCPHCAQPVDPALPFCARCGRRLAGMARAGDCGRCGTPVQLGIDVYCARCGVRLDGASALAAEPGASTAPMAAVRQSTGISLALLDVVGVVQRTIMLAGEEAIVGRTDGELRFPDDPYLSPMHAQLSLRQGQLWVRDLGSRNGSWIFLDAPCRLADGDVLIVGSQLLRFRRLGYPGPQPPEADATRRMGSVTPTADIAVLEQLRGDASVRDVFHLSPGRDVHLGRETGDWVFPYDKSMSGRHAEVRSVDSEFVVHDTGSRNGIAMAVRGERVVRAGERLMFGEQILRVESV